MTEGVFAPCPGRRQVGPSPFEDECRGHLWHSDLILPTGKVSKGSTLMPARPLGLHVNLARLSGETVNADFVTRALALALVLAAGRCR